MNLTITEMNSLVGLFPDGGVGFLKAAGVQNAWKKVLAPAPEIKRGPTPLNPWRVIAALRDHWVALSNWRAAYVGTQILYRYHQAGAGPGHHTTLFELAYLGTMARKMGE